MADGPAASAPPARTEFPSLVAAEAMAEGHDEMAVALRLSRIEDQARRKDRKRQHRQSQQQQQSAIAASLRQTGVRAVASAADATGDDGMVTSPVGAKLVSMGFAEGVAVQALSASRGDLRGAMEWALAMSSDAPCGMGELLG
jgi:hypothetical protein